MCPHQSTALPASVAALRSQLQAQGFRPGRPAHLPAAVLALDVAIYSRQRCAPCNRRLRVRPYHRGQSYRLLCGCPCCRLAPRDEDHEGHYDFYRLNWRDVERVAGKVIDHCKEEGTRPTAPIVRQFVDEELGIDRAAKAEETRRRREEEAEPLLGQFLVGLTGTLDGEAEKLATLTDAQWARFGADEPGTMRRLLAAYDALGKVLRRAK